MDLKRQSLLWSVIIGTSIVRTITFICIPFIVIKLTLGNLPSYQIGIILGCGWLFGIIGGYQASFLSDLIGRKKLMSFTLSLWSVVFIFFLINQSIIMMFILNIVNGLCRAIHDPISQSIISDSTSTDKQKKKYFNYRYLAANVGGAIGPLIGSLVTEEYISITFMLCFLILVLYSIINLFFEYPQNRNKKNIHIKFNASIKMVIHDMQLKYLIVAGTTIAAGVAIVDLIPLILKDKGLDVQIFPKLLTLNAITVLLFQVIVSKLASKIKEHYYVYLGSILFTLGLIMIGVASNVWYMHLGMFIFTIGEIIILPMGSVLVDKIAPRAFVGTYYGAYNFRTFGNFVAPIVAGILMNTIGSVEGFTLLGIVCILSMYYYNKFFMLSCKAEKV
ncbi:MFS transporter [Bacillus mycoides]|uniref:MFS transporter n=1 Tax=Bacillus mycoides TaxID=1405 RepID=UPI003CFE6AD6